MASISSNNNSKRGEKLSYIYKPEGMSLVISQIVQTDEEIGDTFINIPIPDIHMVRQLLDIVGKMFR